SKSSKRASTASSEAGVPFIRWIAIDWAIASRLVSSGQAASQLSTESAQASQGSTGTGQVSGSQSAASGTGTSPSRAVAAASARSSGVDAGGRRSVGIAAVLDLEPGTPGGLGRVAFHVGLGLGQDDALDAFDSERRDDSGERNVAAQAAVAG